MQVDTKGATIVAGFDDGVVRLLSFQKKETVDVHGRKHTDQTELALAQALKPHNGRVTCVAVDSTGEYLATGVIVFILTLCLLITTILVFTPRPFGPERVLSSPSFATAGSAAARCYTNMVQQIEFIPTFNPSQHNFLPKVIRQSQRFQKNYC